MSADEYALDREPCPRCLGLADADEFPHRFVQPLPPGALAPQARDGSGKCCRDCASADALISFSRGAMDFTMARIAVGNDRDDQFRLPGVSIGLAKDRLIRFSDPGDLMAWWEWAEHHGIGFLRAEEQT